ncbi:5832_t:CDS:2, partial [Gigaspora margarita]
ALPIDRKLMRVTQEKNQEEILVNRRKYRLILEGRVKRTDKQFLSTENRNMRPSIPDSSKEKKIANGFSRKFTRYKEHHEKNKKRENYSGKRSIYIENPDENSRGFSAPKRSQLQNIQPKQEEDNGIKHEEKECLYKGRRRRLNLAMVYKRNKENREETLVEQSKEAI